MIDKSTKFEDFIESDRWRDLETHFRESSSELEENISQTVKAEQSLKVKARQYLEKDWKIKSVTDDMLRKAEELLFGSQVCAADGTYAIVSLSTTGIKGQIGVVTTSYVNKRTDYVSHFFEPLLHLDEKEFDDILQARMRMRDDSDALSSNHIRAIMLYMERKKALERSEQWKMVNGDIFPFELRTGQGRLRGLKACLDLEMQIFSNPYFIGITANSKDYVLNTLALGLNAGEYVDIKSYKDELDRFLDPNSRAAHFNPKDLEMFQHFAKTYGDNMRVGLYKVQKRAYIFYAHRDHFDEAAAIIMRDASFQPTRGYPLLIDYADSICTRLVAASDFTRQVSVKLAKHGALEEEIDEHLLRRR